MKEKISFFGFYISERDYEIRLNYQLERFIDWENGTSNSIIKECDDIYLCSVGDFVFNILPKIDDDDAWKQWGDLQLARMFAGEKNAEKVYNKKVFWETWDCFRSGMKEIFSAENLCEDKKDSCRGNIFA